jgi:hypothetical protein
MDYDFRNSFRFVKNYLKTKFHNDVSIISFIEQDWDQSKKNVVIMSVDHWGDDEFLLTPFGQRPKTVIEGLLNLVNNNPNHMFYLLTVCPFLQELVPSIENLKVIHWGEDFSLGPINQYHQLDPVDVKTFSESWHWTCLNNNVRMNRNICVMMLLGENIPNGYIRLDSSSIMPHPDWKSFLTYLKINKYKYLQSVSSLYPTLQHGFDRIKKIDGYCQNKYEFIDSVGVARGSHTNFDRYLRNIFGNSTVDIIVETVLINRSGIITEKYLNSIYGYNFPIYIGMAGSVNHLRKLGFDLFDDVIDHGYDTIQDHYTRMFTAINSNRQILENRELALTHWNQCKDRFNQNYRLIQEIYKNKEDIAIQYIEDSLKEEQI